MSDAEELRFEADGSMTISGRLFDSLEALARDLGVSPEQALRRAVDRAWEQANAQPGGDACPNS